MFRSAADDVICKSLKIDKTTVGAPRAASDRGSAPTLPFGARQATCAIPAPKIMPNVLGKLNLTII